MERLARTIERAAEIREKSFDQVQCDKDTESVKGVMHTIDTSKYYALTLKEACDEACDENGWDTRATQIVYLILRNSWNESLDWAKEVSEG